MFLRRQAGMKFIAQVVGLALSTVLNEKTVQLTLEKWGRYECWPPHGRKSMYNSWLYSWYFANADSTNFRWKTGFALGCESAAGNVQILFQSAVDLIRRLETWGQKPEDSKLEGGKGLLYLLKRKNLFISGPVQFKPTLLSKDRLYMSRVTGRWIVLVVVNLKILFWLLNILKTFYCWE